MKITGFDLSLTSAGVAVVEMPRSAWQDGKIVTSCLVPPAGLSRYARMRFLYTEARALARGSDIVVVEGPSFASANRQHEMGGMWWMVTYTLWADRHHIVVVPPSNLKKYATGSGNASKDLVLANVVRRYKDALVNGNDEADALVLAAMAADFLGCPLVKVPKVQRAALDKWPYDPVPLYEPAARRAPEAAPALLAPARKRRRGA